MKNGYCVAVVGATGAVGSEMIRTLEQRGFPVSEMKLLASKRSAGGSLTFQGKEVLIEEATPDSFEGVDIALFSAGGSVSAALAPEAVKRGAVVIDNTSHFRMHPDVPLVVPEVNPEDIWDHQGIIANPNCSTIQMVHALKPLQKQYGIRKIVVSTYQAVSGTGVKAIEELKGQHRDLALGKEVKANVYPHQIAYNVIPQIDVFEENGFTKEEMKMINETKKIMHDAGIEVNATCVRVPVERGHSESVYVEMNKPFALKEVKEILEEAENVVLQDDSRAQQYPMPLYIEGRGETFVGRLRKDLYSDTGLTMWIVADNLLKGAALNAVQIAEMLVNVPAKNGNR